MSIFDAIILAIIEGFTEFLPISSTGHMIIVADFLGLKQDSATKAYEVIIQLSAILAILIHFKDKIHINKFQLWLKMFVAFLPLAIVGFIFKDTIKELFSVQIVAVMFIVGGVVFLILEKFYDEKKAHITNFEDASFKQSFLIGIAQVFALIPGTSRAGATIVGGLLVGLSRKASAEFSFLLALPVMGAVSGYDILKHHDEFSGANMIPLIIGFIISFIVAYYTIKLFRKFLEKFTFVAFGIYRILFGIILLYLI
jgi:undecaprenyl-diphosphatase